MSFSQACRELILVVGLTTLNFMFAGSASSLPLPDAYSDTGVLL